MRGRSLRTISTEHMGEMSCDDETRSRSKEGSGMMREETSGARKPNRMASQVEFDSKNGFEGDPKKVNGLQEE